MSTEPPKPWHSDEDVERYDTLFPLLPDFSAHYTIGGKLSPRIGIPDRDALYLGEDILAVLVANQMGVGLDYARKKYVKDFTKVRWLGLTETINSIFQEGREGFGWYLSYAKDLELQENSLQDLSIQFFYRNIAAFDASKRLAELGYLCEVAVILRSALEQFAFCANLWTLKGSEDIGAISRKESLIYFRQFVPSAGRLYGLLSKYTHFEYDHHTHFFAHSPSEILTVQRAPVLRAYATHLLFLTMSCVAVFVLKASGSDDQKLNFVTHLQKFEKRVYDYSDEVCSMLKSDEVLATFDILLVDILKK